MLPRIYYRAFCGCCCFLKVAKQRSLKDFVNQILIRKRNETFLLTKTAFHFEHALNIILFLFYFTQDRLSLYKVTVILYLIQYYLPSKLN